MTMEDVEISAGDNNKTQSMALVYGYSKTKVPIKGMADLLECPHLGGNKALSIQ
jgi:hypothetical protein